MTLELVPCQQEDLRSRRFLRVSNPLHSRSSMVLSLNLSTRRPRVTPLRDGSSVALRLELMTCQPRVDEMLKFGERVSSSQVSSSSLDRVSEIRDPSLLSFVLLRRPHS
ncbi:hypothetical protein TNCV_2263781 [Trichonephila clavipes]|nr:hypothetical protein TNCV_2263781 [Trichonephila clavipes]